MSPSSSEGHDAISHEIEHLRYKLFEAIIDIKYGRCNSIDKSEIAIDLVNRHADEIADLKNTCLSIVVEVEAAATAGPAAQQHLLKDQLETRLVGPLSSLFRSKEGVVLEFIKRALVDSTTIGAILAALSGGKVTEVALGAVAGTVSASISTWRDHRANAAFPPSSALLRRLLTDPKTSMESILSLNAVRLSSLQIPAWMKALPPAAPTSH
jgi:hypothetical protein